MTVGLGIYRNKVCKDSSEVQECIVVVKSIEKAIEYEKVIALDKPIGFVVKITCLARHSERLRPLCYDLDICWSLFHL